MTGKLEDGHGRVIEYLRVSVTDRCGLRCVYCMPPSGIEKKPRCDILRYKDLLRIIGIFAGLGVRKARFTGGEPLIRKGITGFLRQAGAIKGIERMAVTTNGVMLPMMASGLKEAGVEMVNISLDTLREDRYRAITGRPLLSRALAGLDAAIEAGVGSVKINMVVMKGINDDEVERFAELTMEKKIQVRFLEFMPATPGLWDRGLFIPSAKVKERLSKSRGLEPAAKERWGGPARIYRLEGALGEIGFISAVSEHFCAGCNRLRLTSTGRLINCLFGSGGLDINEMLNSGASDEEIENAVRDTLTGKGRIRSLPSGTNDEKRDAMARIGG
ncbi:MAG: GTP 3',8-cyclase MoaA [Candidatus Nitrospinota bacterium M3_3B_026]